MRRRLVSLLLACVLLAICAPVPTKAVAPGGQGKIVVNHDEWTLSNTGFSQLPADTAQFALNLANWFSGDGIGNFLVYSTNFGLTESGFLTALQNAGHTVTVSTAVPFTVANLMPYDAVFLAGNPADNQVLIDYVTAGGGVYVAGGKGWNSEHLTWQSFLNHFGFQFNSPYNGVAGNLPVGSGHPIFAGVGQLFQNNGNTVSLTGGAGPGAQIAMINAGLGLIGIYEADCDAALTWEAPLGGSSPYTLPAGGMLPIRFGYGTCSSFIRDESVIIVIQDLANPDFPVTAFVYGADIVIDTAYRVDFQSGLYGLSPGTQLAVYVYIGYELVGSARVDIGP